jgi:hypothetical protein
MEDARGEVPGPLAGLKLGRKPRYLGRFIEFGGSAGNCTAEDW